LIDTQQLLQQLSTLTQRKGLLKAKQAAGLKVLLEADQSGGLAPGLLQKGFRLLGLEGCKAGGNPGVAVVCRAAVKVEAPRGSAAT
jgi:hypothetical protein